MSAEPEGRTTFERALMRRAQEGIADENARAEDLLQGRNTVRSTKAARPIVGKVLVALAVACVLRLAFYSSLGTRGTQALNAVALASADGTGLGSSPVGFLTERPPVPQPSAPNMTATPTPSPSDVPSTSRRALGARRAASTEEGAPHGDDFGVLLTAHADPGANGYAAEIGLEAPAPASPAVPSPSPATVVNMGTRLAARLDNGVRTGATLTPATAVLTEDLRSGERVILPAGSRVVGSAFATTGDDRVQLVWRALVINGRTVPVDGETLAIDGTVGMVGKVIARRGKGLLRRIGSVALGAAGVATAYGVPAGSGLLGRAGDVAADQAGRELERMGQQREWLQADKVVELRAGASCIIYVSSDIVLPRESGR